MKMIQALIWLMLLFAISNTAYAIGFFHADAEVSYAGDDNVTNGSREKDIREDTFYEVNAGVGYRHDFFGSQLLGYSLRVGTKGYSVFDKLNESRIRGGIKYSFQFSRGFTAPVFSIDFFGIEKSSNSDIRDSSTAGVTFQMSRWLTDKTSLIAGLGVTEEEAEGTVFDLERTRAFVNIDLLLTSQWTGFATYVFIDGDVVSTGEGDSLEVINAACPTFPCDALEPDDAFGGIATNQFAYRLMAQTQIVTLGLNWKIKEGQSVDMSIRLLNSTTDYGIEYDSMLLRASYLISFK